MPYLAAGAILVIVVTVILVVMGARMLGDIYDAEQDELD